VVDLAQRRRPLSRKSARPAAPVRLAEQQRPVRPSVALKLHRNSRPGSVRVLEVHGQPQPKLIDFGIAPGVGRSP